MKVKTSGFLKEKKEYVVWEEFLNSSARAMSKFPVLRFFFKKKLEKIYEQAYHRALKGAQEVYLLLVNEELIGISYPAIFNFLHRQKYGEVYSKAYNEGYQKCLNDIDIEETYYSSFRDGMANALGEADSLIKRKLMEEGVKK
jgi:hypothetical protein